MNRFFTFRVDSILMHFKHLEKTNNVEFKMTYKAFDPYHTYANYTVNTLYTDIRYKDKKYYTDNLTCTKPSLKRRQLIRFYARTLY